MKNQSRIITLTLVIALIVLTIFLLEKKKVQEFGEFDSVELSAPSTGMDLSEKEKMFEKAKEITTPDGFINGEAIDIEQYLGKKVVMIDFWTYSCINCQRTFPYLNAWYDKYEDEGLVIIGIHTPEFEFEKEYENVVDAVERYGIKFPVVLDNDFSTWRAYQNRYWPRKYLIDIDGFIVYDHIGEGGYEETEEKIQELLAERAERLGETITLSDSFVEVNGEVASFVKSPEIYFGASRNAALANGVPYLEGLQVLELPSKLEKNGLYLDGSWQVNKEYIVNTSGPAKIVFPYEAANVFMVASAENDPIDLIITRDGKPLNQARGQDIEFRNGEDHVMIEKDQLYRLIEDDSGSAEHTIEILIPEAGFQAFTFTFG